MLLCVHESLASFLQIQRTVPVVDERKEVDHLAELGPMIEEMESTMRTSVDSLYISKVWILLLYIHVVLGAVFTASRVCL